MFSKKFLIAQLLFALTASLLFVVYYTKAPKKPAIPVYGQVADFSLQNQFDKTVTLKDFSGKVWVADFIFTSCSGICPTMSRHMMGLHQEFAQYPDVKMVSISVNPETDSPQKLADYAKRYKVQGDSWIFLTGKRQVIEDLAIKSFKMGDMKDIVFHSAYFALVDRYGNIRGFYDGTEEDRIKQLQKDVRTIMRER